MLHFYFGTGVLTLPRDLAKELKGATLTELRVLLALADNPLLGDSVKDLADAAGCREKEARAAIDRWISLGILKEDAPADAKPAKRRPRLSRADELPLYTSTELSDLLEQRTSIKSLIDAAADILGKFLTPGDMNILIGMVDYLGMEEEAVLLTLAHCRKMGRTNLRSIEKYAFTLADKGYRDAASLEDEFLREEAYFSFEGEIRTLFGLKARSLTSKEEKFLKNWVDFGYDASIVRRAYEITVNATGDASLPYANAILETWHAAELKSGDEIDAYLEKETGKKTGRKGTTLGNSFDTDEFFEAALKRSFAGKGKGE